MRLPIRIDRRFRLLLLLWGVRRGNAYLAVDGEALEANFGFFHVRTSLANVERWEISGPYRWYTSIGVRGTPGKPEITFGGSSHGGIALFFRQPIPFWWIRRLRVLYLTLDDLGGFARLLVARGVDGRDLRADDRAGG